jgi:hypothetical protein
MGHFITAILLKGDYDYELASVYDLQGIGLGYGITMFHITPYFTAYWQAMLKCEGYLPVPETKYLQIPDEIVIAELMKLICNKEQPEYALIATNYFGGFGYQAAYVFQGKKLASEAVSDINQALRFMGINARPGLDEFDTMGLSNHRSPSEHLRRYADLVDEMDL